MDANQVRKSLYELVYQAVDNARRSEQDFPIPAAADLKAYIQFENTEFRADAERTYLNVYVRHTSQNQETIAPRGVRTYENFGSLYVEINTKVGVNMLESDWIARVIKDAVMAHEEYQGIYFSNTFASEEGRTENNWNRVTMQADFSYYEVK